VSKKSFFLFRALFLLGPFVLSAACGSRTALDDDAFYSSPTTLNPADGGVDVGIHDGSVVVQPVRDDAGRIISCGKNLPGPALIRHADYFGHATCIDATEVTNAQYAEFLANDPHQQFEACPSTLHLPHGGWPASTDHGDYPVVNVDWCSARAFCAWAGKALCKNVGIDPSNPAHAGDPQIDEWSAACTGNRAQSYPYGANYDPSACNGADLNIGHTTPVLTPSACEGSDVGLYGMSGNVWEWEDACENAAASSALCLVRGGSYSSDKTLMRCDSSTVVPRTFFEEDIGFRCCLD
jgi:hypothetical protein